MLLFIAATACAVPRAAPFRDPLTPEEHINLGVSYEKRGELDAALKEYRTAAQKAPIAYLYEGNVYFRQNAFDDAEGSYEKAIKETNSPEAYNNLAWLYYTRGVKLDEAEQLAARAVELSPASEGFRDTLDRIREKRDRQAGPS
jgi:tetratricopeptide (TPR) repeat protein